MAKVEYTLTYETKIRVVMEDTDTPGILNQYEIPEIGYNEENVLETLLRAYYIFHDTKLIAGDPLGKLNAYPVRIFNDSERTGFSQRELEYPSYD